MNDYRGNSNAGKSAQQPTIEKRVDAPVTSNVKVKKKNNFFAQDMKTTAKGVTNDILMPGIKNLIVNVIKKAVDYLFLGTYTPNNGGFTDYRGISRNITYGNSSSGSVFPNQPAQTKSSIAAIEDIVFNDRAEAEEVLSRMNEIISRYGMISVLDFYDLIDQSRRVSPTDNDYGWKDISTATISRSIDGYRINLPRIICLK